MDPWIYFGGVGAVFLLSVVGMLVILLRQRASQPPRRPRAAPPPSAARVGLVQAEDGGPIRWVVGGQLFDDPSELTDADQRARVERFRAQLQQALGDGWALPSASAEVLPPQAIENSTPPATPLPVEQEAGHQPPPAPAPVAAGQPAPPESPPPAPPPRPMSYDEAMQRPLLERLWNSFFGTSYEERPRLVVPPPPSEALRPPAMQVQDLDMVLQKRLMLMEALPEAHILLRDDGLLDITLGSQRYEHIDDIPDEAVRQAMHQSVQEWLRSGGAL